MCAFMIAKRCRAFTQVFLTRCNKNYIVSEAINFVSLIFTFNFIESLLYSTVILMLEGSGKWPEDVQAIRRIKTAFLLQVAEQLNNVSGVLAVPKVEHIDVLLVCALY